MYYRFFFSNYPYVKVDFNSVLSVSFLKIETLPGHGLIVCPQSDTMKLAGYNSFSLRTPLYKPQTKAADIEFIQ